MANVVYTFLKRVKHELFSFIGLSLSAIAFIMNVTGATAASFPSTIYVTYQDAQGITHETTAISPIFIITIALIILIVYFAFRFFKKRS